MKMLIQVAAAVAVAPFSSVTAWDPWTTEARDVIGGGACFQAQAVTLQNGTVLVAGGSTDLAHAKQTHLWDPARNSWSAGPPMFYGRKGMGMAVLTDGRVMVAGGDVYRNDDSGYISSALAATVEILDPATGVWARASKMTTPRQRVSLAALADGSAVAFGGTNSADQYGYGLKTAERWDPSTQTWAPIEAKMSGNMGVGSQAATCANGSVLVSGQYAAVMYDPESQTFTADIAKMTTQRGAGFGLAALGNGSLVAAGGFDGYSNLQSAEIYMPAGNLWVPLHAMHYKRAGAAATTLRNSSVLVVGASAPNGATAELWDPAQWRCYAAWQHRPVGSISTTFHRGADTCHRSHDGTGVNLQTCQEACGPPVCQTAPCQNGGTCSVEKLWLAAGRGRCR